MNACEYHPKHSKRRDLSKMREVDTYGDYLVGICASSLLRLSDGGQAVHLERRFVGATLSHDGSHWQRHGVPGQADLCGGLVVEFNERMCAVCGVGAGCSQCGQTGSMRSRIEVRLEVEVKTSKGRIGDAQKARQAAFQKRGGVYLIVRSVDDAVAQIVAERDRIAAFVG